MAKPNLFKRSKAESDIADVLFAHEERIRALLAEDENDDNDEGKKAGEPEFDTAPGSCSSMPTYRPSWAECIRDAQAYSGTCHEIEELFTEAERRAISLDVAELNENYRIVHRLDAIDIAIPVAAGLISSLVDTLLVGVPQRTKDGLRAAPLENYVRDWFEKAFPVEDMDRLAQQSTAKVPYDAPYSSGFTSEYVEGLYPTMHRLYSIGHDPLLGLIVGTHDILMGEMTTIDKLGKVVCQKMGERYAGREEATVFAALCKQVIHMKTDVNTAMGLPAPLMGLFNLMQFGSIGEEDLTVAEIVQGMYYEGYDFKHFCAQSMPAMLNEVIVRLGYFLKRINEGHSIGESIPLTTNRERRPKLGTMLFVAHSISTGINAGKVAFSKNPMEINYPQWIAFAIYSFKQVKWIAIDKPYRNYKYVMDSLEADIIDLAMSDTENVVVIGELS